MKAFIKKLLRENVNHELIHAYEDIYNDMPMCNILGTVFDVVKSNISIDCSKTLIEFFNKLYISDETEINAMVGEVGDVKSFEELKTTTSWKNYLNMFDFDPNREYINVLAELEKGRFYPEHIIKFDDEFGDYVLKIYKKLSKDNNFYPNRKILSLKGKNIRKVFELFSKDFKEKKEYMRRKLLKRIITE